jgi:hypothetical protein
LLLGLALPLALWFNARTLFDFSKTEFSWLFLLIVPLTLSSLNNGQANIMIMRFFSSLPALHRNLAGSPVLFAPRSPFTGKYTRSHLPCCLPLFSRRN